MGNAKSLITIIINGRVENASTVFKNGKVGINTSITSLLLSPLLPSICFLYSLFLFLFAFPAASRATFSKYMLFLSLLFKIDFLRQNQLNTIRQLQIWLQCPSFSPRNVVVCLSFSFSLFHFSFFSGNLFHSFRTR